MASSNSGLALFRGLDGGLVVCHLRVTELSGLVDSLGVVCDCLLEILDLLIELCLLSSDFADGGHCFLDLGITCVTVGYGGGQVGAAEALLSGLSFSFCIILELRLRSEVAAKIRRCKQIWMDAIFLH